MRHFYLYLCLFLLLFSSEIISQTPSTSPADEKDSEKLASYIVGKFTVLQEDGTPVYAITPLKDKASKAIIYLPDRVISAESIIAWVKKKDEATPSGPSPSPTLAGPIPPERESPSPERGKKTDYPFAEIYAEGNLEITMGKDRILADCAYYDIRNGRGVILNVEIHTIYTDEKSNIPPEAVPLIIRAKEVYQINETTLIAKNASVTTCSHGAPHYDLLVKTIVFTRDEGGKRFVFYHIFPRISGIPFFYIPYLSKTIGSDPFIRAVRIENSTRFGNTVHIKYGLNLREPKVDDNGIPLKNKDGSYIYKRCGDFTIQNDYYQKRGLGWMPELSYNHKDYTALVKGYYIRDKGPDPDIAYDRQFLPMETDKRGRLRGFQRVDNFLYPHLRLDTEFSYLSDRHFLQEYFDTEFKEGKEQETYGYLRLNQNNQGLSLLERSRLNDFQTQVEYLPRLSYSLLKQPLLTLGQKYTLYFSDITEVANRRLQLDEDLNQSATPRNVRFDTYNEITLPFHFSALAGLSLTPFLAGRYTAYEDGALEEDYTDRWVGTNGLRLFTQFYRVFNTNIPALGLNQVRHSISFDARYTNNSVVTTSPTKLIQYDSVDQMDRFTEYYLEIRNRFGTKGAGSGDGPFRDFLTIGAAVEYYPDAQRDTTQVNTANYLYPMNWIVLAPDSHQQYLQRDFSNIYLDLAFTPQSFFSVYLDTQYNSEWRRTEIFNTSLNINPYPGWSTSLSQRYSFGNTNATGLALTCSPIEKWQVSISEQYDFRADAFTNRSYTFRRDLHEFYLDFIVSIDAGKNEKSFNIMFTPKGIFERPIKLRSE